MTEVIDVFKVLSDETRLRIMLLLYNKSLCVCQIQAILEETQPKISKHLGKLRDLNFVESKRLEQLMYYEIDHSNKLLIALLEDVVHHLEKETTYTKDMHRLKHVDDYIQVKAF
ncbi:ArsR/SmtB family transcription factor [Petrocella sp. FN5]|uniref:ArsR/SmtB family transcription factor n=1 Tax=Petrocella sp. FN5 TaxID=3032002 RepID=UPI0023DB5519|nr:metalloregulator ArsR/SmtB family transcription factor [Petrocella sp. FN5]MDF1618271.1 metalloregulator ArsR/SmtB family transcription factor [Petrocella sp. FN5]